MEGQALCDHPVHEAPGQTEPNPPQKQALATRPPTGNRSKMTFIKGLVHNLSDGKSNGIVRDDGGNPPIALKIGNGSLFLVCQIDRSRVTVPGECVHLRPPLGRRRQRHPRRRTHQAHHRRPTCRRLDRPPWQQRRPRHLFQIRDLRPQRNRHRSVGSRVQTNPIVQIDGGRRPSSSSNTKGVT